MVIINECSPKMHVFDNIDVLITHTHVRNDKNLWDTNQTLGTLISRIKEVYR